MGGQSPREQQVVRTVPGPNTGDTYLVTASGECWRVVRDLPRRGTGDRQGTTDGRTIWEKP